MLFEVYKDVIMISEYFIQICPKCIYGFFLKNVSLETFSMFLNKSLICRIIFRLKKIKLHSKPLQTKQRGNLKGFESSGVKMSGFKVQGGKSYHRNNSGR